MKRLITTFILVVSLIFAVGTQVANADLITSSSDAALAGATVIDFEGQAKGTYTSIAIGDVTLTANNNLLRIDNVYGSQYNMTGTYLENGSYGFNSMTIDFGAETTAFGFNWGASDNPWVLSAYDASSNLLESYNLPITGGSNSGDFVGLATSGIDYAILSTVSSGGDWVLIDNITYNVDNVVPVPGAVLLGLLGLSAAGIKLRKQS